MDNKEPSELAVVAQQSGLEPSKVELLLTKFGPDVQRARELIAQAASIVVTDESQLDQMKAARELRLQLKKVRLSTEATREGLKKGIVREGKAIDGMSNIIKALIVPIEEKLERDEKFAEVKQAERKAQKKAERLEKLAPYVEDLTIYNLEDMTDAVFETLLDLSVTAHNHKQAQKEAERVAEEQRKAEEAKKQAETEAELKRLREEQRLKDEEAAKERAKVEAEREKERKAAADKLKAEQETRLKLEREAEERRKEEEARKLAEETLRKAKEEEQRKALLAPDKEKLMSYADEIDSLTGSFSVPAVQSSEAADIIKQTKELLTRVGNNIRTRAQEL